MQRGREMGLTLSDERFNAGSRNIRKEKNLDDDRRSNAALKQEGMTLADLRRNVERQFLIQRSAARRTFGAQDPDHRGGGAPVLRGAPAGVHRTGDRDAARDPHRGARGTQQGPAASTSARTTRPLKKVDAVRAARGAARTSPSWRRSLRRAVEGERRADRADRDGGAVAGAAEAAREAEAGRHLRAAAASRRATRSSSSKRSSRTAVSRFEQASRRRSPSEVYNARQRERIEEVPEPLRERRRSSSGRTTTSRKPTNSRSPR